MFVSQNTVAFIVLIGLGLGRMSVCAQKIFVLNNKTAVKGGSITIICQNAILPDENTNVYKTADGIVTTKTISIGVCSKNLCLDEKVGRYTFNANTSDIFITITNLNVSEDQNYWSCGSASQNVNMFLTVFVLPTQLTYNPVVNTNKDLAVTDLNMRCETDCSNPEFKINWFYIQVGQSSEQWFNNGTAGPPKTCTGAENIYSSTLTLNRYTTFSNNQNMTVMFKCGIKNLSGMPPGVELDLLSPPSVEVNFAVKVTSVTLMDGSSMPPTTSLVVTEKEPKTLTCVTSFSRPVATVIWYIGNTNVSGSYSVTYTPTNDDHDKTIYCKAYNFQPDGEFVLSAKPRLFVQVMVTSATIIDNNSNAKEEIVVTQNQSKTLHCSTSNSRPPASIVWYVGGEIKSRNNTYSFIPSNSDHNKTIYCTAFNIQPENDAVASASSKLYVKVPAVSPSLKDQTESKILLINDAVVFECVSSRTRPAASVNWKLQDIVLSNVRTVTTENEGLFIVNSFLTITPNKTYDNKIIYCETYIDGQNLKPAAGQHVRVYWPPSQPNITEYDVFPWFEGNTGKYLECRSSDDGNPLAETKWSTIVDQSVVNNKRFLMPSLTSQHNGLIITCKVENEFTLRKSLNITNTVRLNVEYRPVIKVQIDNNDVVNVSRTEGENLIATCSASGNPIPKVLWTQSQTKQLRFMDIDRKNDGLYGCEASASSTKHGNLTSSKQLRVVVFYAPTVKVQFSKVLQEYVPMTINCNATGNPDSFTFTILKQTWNEVFIRSINVLPNGMAIIPNTTIDDSGNYTCFVQNGIADKTGQFQQNGTSEALVKGKPKVTRTASSFFIGKFGDNMSITIPFYSYPEITTVSFINQNGTNISDTDKHKVVHQSQKVKDFFYNTLVEVDGYVAMLQLASQNENDVGNYTLFLRNSEGTTEWNFRHILQSEPSTPSHLRQLDEKAVSSVTLRWIPGFNGGLQQTFVLQYKEIRTQYWTTINMTHHGETEMTYTIENLSHSKQYEVVLFAKNIIGTSKENLTITVTTAAAPTPAANEAIIGGAVGGAVFAILVVLVVLAVLFIRRRRTKNGTDTSGLAQNIKGRQETEEDSSDEDVMVENKMYESAGQILTKEDPVYNKPVKKAKVDTKFTDVYAVVDKSKKKDNQKMKKEKPKKKKQFAQGDIYENSPAKSSAGNNTYGNAAFDDNPYENPEGLKPSNTPKRNVNQDGLIYADLAFNDQPKGQKKLVIHGLDEMTTYVQVDFNKKADPLPDSDTEEQSTNKK